MKQISCLKLSYWKWFERIATIMAWCLSSEWSLTLWSDGTIQNWKPDRSRSCGGTSVNWLGPGKYSSNFIKSMFFQPIIPNSRFSTRCEMSLMWMPQNLTDDKSTLHQRMVWCCEATIHYWSQCWPRSKSSYGVKRPQWVLNNRWGMPGMIADHDEIKEAWRHFPHYCPCVRKIHWPPALMFSFLLIWIIYSINNRVTSDLIRHDTHVTWLYWLRSLK